MRLASLLSKSCQPASTRSDSPAGVTISVAAPPRTSTHSMVGWRSAAWGAADTTAASAAARTVRRRRLERMPQSPSSSLKAETDADLRLPRIAGAAADRAAEVEQQAAADLRHDV